MNERLDDGGTHLAGGVESDLFFSHDRLFSSRTDRRHKFLRYMQGLAFGNQEDKEVTAKVNRIGQVRTSVDIQAHKEHSEKQENLETRKKVSSNAVAGLDKSKYEVRNNSNTQNVHFPLYAEPFKLTVGPSLKPQWPLFLLFCRYYFVRMNIYIWGVATVSE